MELDQPQELDGRLAGRAAVVAGAGSLIGRECAVTFAREGADVLAVDPDAGAAQDVAGVITAEGGRAAALATALDSEAGAAAVAEVCTDRWGRLDVLFTAHAMLDHEPSGLAHWERVLRTNLLGPIAYTEALFPLLARSGSGSIVYLSSVEGVLGNPHFPAYSVSKGGLVPLAHVMADRGAAQGIRVNVIAMAAVNPIGTTDPPPLSPPPLGWEALQRATPLGRMATPDDVALAALFLASAESSYITGVVLPVDGGRLAVTPGTGAGATRQSP
jgi:NAD(P)-dependent dehydrogenase (short-subunit alcohol dehydrogenase family)